MLCSKCGFENQEASKFCNDCGAGLNPVTESVSLPPPPPLTPTPAPPAFPTVNCTQCGAPNVKFLPTEEKKTSFILLSVFILYMVCVPFIMESSQGIYGTGRPPSLDETSNRIAFLFGGVVLLLLLLLCKRKQRVTYATCRSCGFEWKVKK